MKRNGEMRQVSKISFDSYFVERRCYVNFVVSKATVLSKTVENVFPIAFINCRHNVFPKPSNMKSQCNKDAFREFFGNWLPWQRAIFEVASSVSKIDQLTKFYGCAKFHAGFRDT